MGTKSRVTVASPFLALALLLTIVLPAAAATPAGRGTDRHCVSHLAAAPAGEDSVVVGSRCFATYEQAFEYGSRGQFNAPSNLRPSDVTPSMTVKAVAAGAPFLLGTYWDWGSYQGTSWSYWGSHGCTSTSGWNLASLSTGFGGADNRFESSKSFSNCNQNRHFEHPNYGGASRLCTPNCSDLGAMIDHTSSLRWWG